MTEQLTLDQYKRPDVCRSRHGGNEQSEAANLRVCKRKDRELIYSLVKASPAGLTLKEACLKLERTPNQISGRFSELKALGRITVGDRRDGCGVHFAASSSTAL